MEWIKVTPETLPEDGESVLVCDKYGTIEMAYMDLNDGQKEPQWYASIEYDLARPLYYFTHWQELPDNPKDE